MEPVASKTIAEPASTSEAPARTATGARLGTVRVAVTGVEDASKSDTISWKTYCPFTSGVNGTDTANGSAIAATLPAGALITRQSNVIASPLGSKLPAPLNVMVSPTKACVGASIAAIGIALSLRIAKTTGSASKAPSVASS